MKPRILLLDSFFYYPNVVRMELLNKPFSSTTNGADGVTYPGICEDIPQWARRTLLNSLRQIMGAPISINTIFARYTSPLIPDAPNKIHSDRVMGEYAAHIYLSMQWPVTGGTSFWTHKTEGDYHTVRTDVTQVMKDTNNPDAWTRNFLIPGAFNRLLIHDANLWHCAEPIGGWGTSPSDGRLVLTAFFNTELN